MPSRNASVALCCLTTAVLVTAPGYGQEKPGSRERGAEQRGPDGRDPGEPGAGRPGGAAPATVGGEEGYLVRRIEILRERLELTEQLGKLEVQRLEVATQGHDRRSRHLLAREEQRKAELEVAEKSLVRIQKLRAQGIVSEQELPGAGAGIREANARLLEVAVERGELDTELATSKIELQTRRIENRLATSELRLELLEAEHQLESRRALRARFDRSRTSDRGGSDAVRGTTERREDVEESVDVVPDSR